MGRWTQVGAYRQFLGNVAGGRISFAEVWRGVGSPVSPTRNGGGKVDIGLYAGVDDENRGRIQLRRTGMAAPG